LQAYTVTPASDMSLETPAAPTIFSVFLFSDMIFSIF